MGLTKRDKQQQVGMLAASWVCLAGSGSTGTSQCMEHSEAITEGGGQIVRGRRAAMVPFHRPRTSTLGTTECRKQAVRG
jgi:hypothetical protein